MIIKKIAWRETNDSDLGIIFCLLFMSLMFALSFVYSTFIYGILMVIIMFFVKALKDTLL